MKTILLLLAITAVGQTYNGSFLNLYSPISGTSQGDFEFSMNHRFFSAALKDEPLESFFGLDSGANVRFGMRYYAGADFYLGASHTRLGHSNAVNAGWARVVGEDFEFGIEAGYFNTKPSSNADREGGLTATGSFSVSLLDSRLRPVLNYAFDGYRENNGAGFGIDFQVAEKISLFGEYFPSSNEDSPEDCFGFGSRYNTWGHQFLLGLTNSSGIGIYDQLEGSNTRDLSFALSIRRVF